MPYAIDEERLNDPGLKVLDIQAPPMKAIPHQEYPKMVYLHPKDKSKEHLAKVVGSPEELELATAKGYRLQPHIPVVSDEPELESGEFETTPMADVAKRGPGRPRQSEAA